MTIREEIIKLIQKTTAAPLEKIRVMCPEKGVFGDYTTNIALQLKKPADEIAGKLKADLFEKIEVAGPGFINFFLSKEYLQKQVGKILKEKDKFGQLKIGQGQKINVEFISANPTGPLTLGNGRGGFCGDVLSNVLAQAGYQVAREYYINDVGEQIKKLGHSVIGDSEAVYSGRNTARYIEHPAHYRGRYIEDLRKKIAGDDPEKVGEAAAKVILKEMIRPTVNKMKIEFDAWFSEKKLHQKKPARNASPARQPNGSLGGGHSDAGGEVEKILDYLKKEKLTYESEGALWFKSSQFGDDKDRVLVKLGGDMTYLASDVAYLKNKFKRGFQKLIFFWGADHYGYIGRIKAAAEALGYKKEQVDIIIMQLVRLIQEGKEVRMSKRTGTYVTLDELIDEVGLDVSRFFFLSRAADTHLNFDLNLAKEQSEKNPVYYVQYAYARISSILRKAKLIEVKPQSSLLEHPSELKLIRQLIRLPEIIEDTVKDYQIQRLPQYATDLAATFHQFYRDCPVISEDKNLTQTRLGLVSATKTILKNILSLMGISAPEKM